jgi:hypothetical protein
MMKKVRIFFLMVLAVVLVSPLFISCGEDEIDGCGLTIVVKDATNPTQRLSNARITISQESGSIRRTGVSDANGEAYFFFDNEAIFGVDVAYGDEPLVRRGKSTVRLKYNEVVIKEVLVAE